MLYIDCDVLQYVMESNDPELVFQSFGKTKCRFLGYNSLGSQMHLNTWLGSICTIVCISRLHFDYLQ